MVKCYEQHKQNIQGRSMWCTGMHMVLLYLDGNISLYYYWNIVVWVWAFRIPKLSWHVIQVMILMHEVKYFHCNTVSVWSTAIEMFLVKPHMQDLNQVAPLSISCILFFMSVTDLIILFQKPVSVDIFSILLQLWVKLSILSSLPC